MSESYVRYSANNSGGSWWVSDAQWRALESAGWDVKWVKDSPNMGPFTADERWLGALATEASLPNATIREAIDSFERATLLDATALGCPCCGPPHSFTLYRDERYVDSYSPDYPLYGSEWDGD